MKKTKLLLSGLILTNSISFAETVNELYDTPVQKLMDKEYKKWQSKLISIKPKDKKALSKSTINNKYSEKKENSFQRQEIMDKEYKKWSRYENFKYKKNKYIEKNNNFVFKKGICSLYNILDKTTILHGPCNIAIYKSYPLQYIFRFNNSRDFFFQKDKKRWLLKEQNIEDKKVVFKDTNDSIIFKTDLYIFTYNK